jgi:hypothetical protein
MVMPLPGWAYAHPLQESLPEDGRVARAPVRVERIARDDTNARPAEPRVEPLRVVAGDGVEHEERLVLGPRLRLGSCHQHLRDASPPHRAADEKLCDLAAVRLVGRQRKDHLHGADDDAVQERRQQQPPTLLDVLGEAVERGSRLHLGERRQIVDGRAAFDAVDEDVRERIEVEVQLQRLKAADFDRIGQRPPSIAPARPDVACPSQV